MRPSVPVNDGFPAVRKVIATLHVIFGRLFAGVFFPCQIFYGDDFFVGLFGSLYGQLVFRFAVRNGDLPQPFRTGKSVVCFLLRLGDF